MPVPEKNLEFPLENCEIQDYKLMTTLQNSVTSKDVYSQGNIFTICFLPISFIFFIMSQA